MMGARARRFSTVTKRTFDAIIIGGGHNGLTCACYLAGRGLKVQVLESRNVVGGAAVTEEFFPNFSNSMAAYSVSLLNPKIISELNLKDRGLEIVRRPMGHFLPLLNGKYMLSGSPTDPGLTKREIAKFSPNDAIAMDRYEAMLNGVVDSLRALLFVTPPTTVGGLKDMFRTLKTAGLLSRLTLPQRSDLLDLFTKSAGEVLDDYFESEPLKGKLAFDAITGHFSSVYAPGSAYVLLHHCFGEINGEKGAWGHAIGGMGSITQAMAAEARHRGVEITLNSPVKQVIVEGGRAVGVEIERASGTEKMYAKAIVANVNPQLLYKRLVAPHHLSADFLARITRYKQGSGTFRMNVALSELPNFTCLPGNDMPHHQAAMYICPSIAYAEAAFQDAKVGGWSRNPVIEMQIPSTYDRTLAPKGQHVASIFCQHFNPVLPADTWSLPKPRKIPVPAGPAVPISQTGQEKIHQPFACSPKWDEVREQIADMVIETITQYAPNFKASILGRMVMSPLDLERKIGLVAGDIFHGRLSLDQMFSARPVLGHGDYRGAVEGLYHCGAGAHPGGGVTGIPGHNAAQEIAGDISTGW